MSQETNKLWKASTIIMLAVFLLSIIPLALAEAADENTDKIVNENIAENTATDEKTDANTNSETNINILPGLQPRLLKEKAEERLEFARGQLQKTRERYLKAKENYQEARRLHNEHKQKLLEINRRAKACNSQLQDCTAIKNELKTGVENHLLKTIDVVERALDKLTGQIEDLEGLSSEEKETALSKITALKEKLTAEEEKISSFNNDTPKEEINTAIADLKQIAKDARKLQRRTAALLVNAKLSKLIEKHEEFRNGMQMRIDTLKAEGADVSKLESLLADFDKKTETLKEDYQRVQEKWGYADTASDFDAWVKDLKEAQNNVRDDLRETKFILRDFLKEYQKLKKSTAKEQN
ncbi:MAG: hypothetical protein AB1668_01200 [Nanoarchaeota archaeon]